MMADRVRKTVTGVSVPGNTTDLDGDTSRVDLDISQFSNALPDNLMFDYNYQPNLPEKPTGMNEVPPLNLRFTEAQQDANTSIIDGAGLPQNGELTGSFDAGQNNFMSNIEASPAEAEYIQNRDASMMDKSMMSNLDMPQAEAEYI